MKKILFMTAVVSIWILLIASASMATPINSIGGGGSEINLQTVLNNITTIPLGASSVNVNTDQVPFDAYWSVGGTGASVSTFVIQITGYSGVTTFGVYDAADPLTKVPIFSGAMAPGAIATLGIALDGSVYLNGGDTGSNFTGNMFGYYITQPGYWDTPPGPDGPHTYYSDSLLNADGFDHMVAFQGKGDTIQIGNWSPGVWGPNEYALAFEDFWGGGDWDYQDNVFMVESVNPAVPEPATMLLLGSGLIGLAGFARRRFKK